MELRGSLYKMLFKISGGRGEMEHKEELNELKEEDIINRLSNLVPRQTNNSIKAVNKLEMYKERRGEEDIL